VPAFTVTVVDAPAASAPTFAFPTTVPPRLTFTVVAPDAEEPAFRTVAETAIWLVSVGFCGVQDVPVTTRSGFGAGVPITWNSATCPPGAPLLAKNCSRTSAARPLTGMVTEFWLVAGSNR
jgi:hypothetical protein